MKFLKTTVALLFFAGAILCGHAQNKSPFDTKKNVQKQTDQMARDLGLNADQKQKVHALNLKKADRRSEIRAEVKANTPKTAEKPSAAVKEKAKNDRKAMRQEYRKGLKAVLTPAQFEKWKELKQEKKTNKDK